VNSFIVGAAHIDFRKDAIFFFGCYECSKDKRFHAKNLFLHNMMSETEHLNPILSGVYSSFLNVIGVETKGP